MPLGALDRVPGGAKIVSSSSVKFVMGMSETELVIGLNEWDGISTMFDEVNDEVVEVIGRICSLVGLQKIYRKIYSFKL